jgi:hypothetical protein
VSRLYTVEEANRTLPYVRAIVGEVRERYKRIQDRGQRHRDGDSEVRAALKTEIRVQAERIHACMEELEEIGAELKDYDLGLVDFPAELEGRRILLCWKFDENEVHHWHEERDGYEGRQPVPLDEPAWPEDETAVRPARRRAGPG